MDGRLGIFGEYSGPGPPWPRGFALALLLPGGCLRCPHTALRTPRTCIGLSFRSFRFEFAQHSPTTRPSVERTAERALMLLDRVKLSSAKARVEGIKGGSVGVGEGIPTVLG